MSVENATYDGSIAAAVVGRSGLFKGEEVVVRVGQCIVVGRSRSCDLSLARAAECLRIGKEAMEQHKSYRKISRKHVRVCLVSSACIEIEDLSTNGTVVDGHRVDRIQLQGFLRRGEPIRVEFGDGELLTVEPVSSVPAASTEARTEIREMQELGSQIPGDVTEDFDRTPVP